jgi:hypothetical protein
LGKELLLALTDFNSPGDQWASVLLNLLRPYH